MISEMDWNINQNKHFNKSIKIMKFSQTFLELTWSQKTAILDTFWSTTEFGIDICYLELLEKLYFENFAPLTYRWAEQSAVKVERAAPGDMPVQSPGKIINKFVT